jgi:glycosyltransferase involved in cell wall biosynthesis
MPLISVIIPVYNGENTIRETIESVLNQTLQDLEVIVVDDGSQDSTLEIVSSIKDPRLKVLSYSNAGVCTNRNRGIAHAVGEYISFIDADDLWTPDKLEAQLKALQENPKAAVAYSWTDWIDESSQWLGRGNYLSDQGDVYAKLLLNDFVANGSNPLIRRQALTEVGGFDESITAAEDWDLWQRLGARYHFVVVPYPQILYRISANSLSTNVWDMESSSLKVIEKAFAQAPQSLQHLKRLSLANRYKYLTVKALEGIPEQKRGFVCARFLWNAIRHDPALLRTRVIWKVLFKIAAVVLLPTHQAQALLAKLNRLSDISALFVHIQKEPS